MVAEPGLVCHMAYLSEIREEMSTSRALEPNYVM